MADFHTLETCECVLYIQSARGGNQHGFTSLWTSQVNIFWHVASYCWHLNFVVHCTVTIKLFYFILYEVIFFVLMWFCVLYLHITRCNQQLETLAAALQQNDIITYNTSGLILSTFTDVCAFTYFHLISQSDCLLAPNHAHFLPVMEKRPRPGLEESGPLSIVGFEHHTRHVGNLIWRILSPTREMKDGQQTRQQPTGEHHWRPLTLGNTRWRAARIGFEKTDESAAAAASPRLQLPPSSIAAPREPHKHAHHVTSA